MNSVIVSGEGGRDSVTHIHVSVHHRASPPECAALSGSFRTRGAPPVQRVWVGPDETKIAALVLQESSRL